MLARRAIAAGSLLAAFVLAGCSDSSDPIDPARPDNVTAEVSESISTVVKVRWKTTESTIGYVQYGPTEAMEFHTPLEATEGTEHAQTLLGLTAETKYYYRVVTWDGGDAGASPVQTVETGYLPLNMPKLTLKGSGHDLFTIVPVLGQEDSILIIDSNGKIVWYHRETRDLDFYRARLSVDGKSLLYNAASVSGDISDDSELVRVALDGSGITSIKVPLLAHDFVEHADGTVGAIVVEYREVDGKQIRGDSIVEIDTAGNQKKIWTAWDCFDPVAHPGDAPEHGWTFANALDYDPATQKYYLSMRNFSSIARINRETAECEWVLGETASTMKFAPGSARFQHEHQFQVRGNRLLVFDNDGALGNESRVLEYELDFTTNTATEVWNYVATPSVYSFVLGEPIRLDNGDTFIAWATAGQLERVNAAGNSIWQLNTGAGFAFAFDTLAASLYPPDAKHP